MTTTEKFVLAIDQGTTSTRAIIFNHSGEIISVGQKEFTQIFPNPGWVEHNPLEIWETTRLVVAEALQAAEINRHQLAAVGITNQRETTVVWDKNTGEPVYNAIVWQDMRTSDIVKELEGDEGPDRFRQICGLGLSPYFSGSKIKWILDNVEGARERAEAGDLYFGNTDSWVLWNLTGGVNGGVHCTDVTNASRTMLMDIRTLSWREDVCEIFGIPMSMLPEIKSSSEIYGYGRKNGLLIDTPRLLHAHEHRHRARLLRQWSAYHGCLQDRRPAGRLRPRRLDCRGWLAGPVAARQPGHDRQVL